MLCLMEHRPLFTDDYIYHQVEQNWIRWFHSKFHVIVQFHPQTGRYGLTDITYRHWYDAYNLTSPSYGRLMVFISNVGTAQVHRVNDWRTGIVPFTSSVSIFEHLWLFINLSIAAWNTLHVICMRCCYWIWYDCIISQSPYVVLPLFATRSAACADSSIQVPFKQPIFI